MVNIFYFLFGLFGIIIIISAIGILIKFLNEVRLKSTHEADMFKDIDITSAKIETIIQIMNQYKGYVKTIVHDNYIICITEYGIYNLIVFDVYGTVSGRENDINWQIKDNISQTSVINPLVDFNVLNSEITKKIGNYEINKYIIMGSNCLFRIPLRSIKIIRMNHVDYLLNKNNNKPLYLVEEVNNIYNKLLYLEDK